MSFLNLSLPGMLAGFAALAGVLFLLQRLRVRYRERTVITTLFWREALEEARARVLVRRFKHLPAYLFVLLIAAMMWFGFADPQLVGATERDHLILIDGSAGMGRGERFNKTIQLVQQRLDDLPRDRVRVVFCGGHPRTLSGPGDNTLLFEARAANVRPEACPATVDRTLRDLTRILARNRPTLILIAGDAPVSQTTIDLLPDGAQVRRLAPPAMANDVNRGITALGVGRSSSGAWEQVDVLCEVTGAGDEELTVALGGRPVDLKSRRTREDDRSRILLLDVPATGELLTVRLQGNDTLVADDSATIRLPKRERIRVAIAADLPAELTASLDPALRSDPAVLLTSDDPHVVIRTPGADPAADVPALEFVPIESQQEAFLFYHVGDEAASQQVLVDSFARLGLSEVDAMDIAQASGQTIAIGAAPAAQRGIGVWASLLSPRFNFVQSRSFPLFVARAVRWLANVEADLPFVAVGVAVPGETGGFIDGTGRRLDPVGTEFSPPLAGTYRNASGNVLAAAILDPATTGAPGGANLEPAGAGDDGGSGVDLALWLAAAILALLLLEWHLFGTGRMP